MNNGFAIDDPKSAALKLFLLGFLGLFLELALIRYLAGSIWNLGYFPNLVLIAVFMGMGIGFVFHERISAQRSPLYFHAAPVLLLILVAFVTFARPGVPGFGAWQGDVGGELFFTAIPEDTGASDSIYFVLWFAIILLTFALVSQRTAKLFRQFPPLRAYSLDIGGSCAGILSFMLVSWLELPAWSWFLALVPLWLMAMPPSSWKARSIPALLIVVASGLAWSQDQHLLISPDATDDVEVAWSPYQKVEFARFPSGEQNVYVNGVEHQQLLGPKDLAASEYDFPHQHRVGKAGLPPYENVLIIGAGTGNDVAAALARGAKHIDAVEIDPAIARFGRLNHRAKPYDDPRVTQIVDDARAFMTRTDDRYDLVIFALTDSLVKVSAMSQLRLENYIFTEESVRRAYSLLKEDGDLLFYNFYREDWLITKIQKVIESATGRAPLTIGQVGTFHMITVGRSNSPPAKVRADGTDVDVTTDDWPFLYLKNRGIPGLYKAAMAGLVSVVALLMFVLHRSTREQESAEAGSSRLFIKVAFVLMGLAFLLLETKGVIQFSLLFGTTWKNNSLVFLAALLLVLAANFVAARVKGDRILPITFVLLLISSLVPLVFPLANLLSVESETLRFCFASLLVFSPIFFANLIFGLIFRDQPVAEHLFGWNLIGTTLGGVVEYTSMWVGYNALSVVVALTYALSFALFFLARRGSGQASPS